MHKDSIGKRIQQVREHFKLSRKEFIQVIKVNLSTISRIEADKQKPSDVFLDALMARFLVNPDWVKTGEGDMLISLESYLQNVIEFLGKEKMAAGIVNLLKSQEFGDVKALAGLNKMLDSGIPDEVAKYLRYVIDTWNHGDEKTRHWVERQLEMAFRDVK